MRKAAFLLPTGLLLLVGMTGCPSEAPVTKTPTVDEPSLPGCRVERLEDAEQAVRQLHGDQAYVYRIDGYPATCKLEVFYAPDENSEETLVWSVTDQGLVEQLRSEAEALDFPIDPHDYHQVLAVTVPGYPPKPDDEFLFSFSIRATASESSDKRTLGQAIFRDAKTAGQLFPDSVLAPSSSHGSGGISPTRHRHLKPGEEFGIVSWEAHRSDGAEAKEGRLKKVDRVRYRVTVTCLEEGKLPGGS